MRAVRRGRRRLPHHRASRSVDLAGLVQVGRSGAPRAVPRAAARGDLVHRRQEALRRRRLRPGRLAGVPAFASRAARARPFLPRSTREARLAYMDESASTTSCCTATSSGSTATCSSTTCDPELATECVRAYNDWLAEFCSADPRRLIPMMMLPFWDIDESVAEMKRAYELGHKGVLFAARYDKVGLPRLVDDYWEPLLGQAQEMGLSHELPRRVPVLPRRPEGRRRPVQEARLHPGELAGAAGQRPEHRRGRAERGLPPLPGPEVRVGRERCRLAALPGREHGLAVAQRGRPQGLPRAAAAERVRAAPDLRHVLVRAGSRCAR